MPGNCDIRKRFRVQTIIGVMDSQPQKNTNKTNEQDNWNKRPYGWFLVLPEFMF